MVDGEASYLLRSHIPHRAKDKSRLGIWRRCRQIGGGCKRRVGMDKLGEAEVENLDVPFRRDEDIVGFEIPMDDAFVVSRCQTVGNLNRIVDTLSNR